MEVAYAASGNENGCCRATREEIDTLLVALQSPSNIVREAGLTGLTAMYKSLPSVKENFELGLLITRRVWVACHDVNEDNCALAKKLWDVAKLEVEPTVLWEELLKDVIHPVDEIQQAGAKALATLIKENPEVNLIKDVLDQLQKFYMEKLAVSLKIIIY